MIQAHDPSVDSIICDEVTCLASCTLDELVQRLPDYSWGQVFSAVDRLSRQGRLRLSRTTRFGYVLTVYSDPLLPNRSETDVERYGVDETADSILVGP
jgi:hypothetical protein